MNKPHPAPARTSQPDAHTPDAPAPRPWARFWFTPVDPVGLHRLRVLAGLLFLAWLLPFAGQVEPLFGLDGWFDTRAYQAAARLPEGPPAPVGWSALYLCGSGPVRLKAFYWASLGVLALFTCGVWTRLTAVLTWVVVASFTANPATAYDGDALLVVLAFYLTLGHVLLGQRDRGRPLAWRVLGGRAPQRPSLGANLALRLLQVHFALVMLFSGLHKLQFGDWWSGLALWYPLHPPSGLTPQRLRELAADPGAYLSVLSLAAYAALAWQVAFPLFAWRARWRPVLVGGALLGWAATAFVYGLPLFGPATLVGCLAYLAPAEWHRLGALPGKLLGRARRAPRGVPAVRVPATLPSPVAPARQR